MHISTLIIWFLFSLPTNAWIYETVSNEWVHFFFLKKIVFRIKFKLRNFELISSEKVENTNLFFCWRGYWNVSQWNVMIFFRSNARARCVCQLDDSITWMIAWPTGYGHMAPTSATGRLFCIAFALFGIPLNGILFASLGDYFGAKVTHLFSFIHCYLAALTN